MAIGEHRNRGNGIRCWPLASGDNKAHQKALALKE